MARMGEALAPRLAAAAKTGAGLTLTATEVANLIPRADRGTS